MPVIEIKKDIYQVGSVDWNIRDFHGYSIYKGTTYNSFLVMDEKIVLFDTVKKDFKDNLLHNIHKIVDPSRINYLIINHAEIDHSGSLPDIMEVVRPEKLFCSPMGKNALLAHFHRDDWPYEVVESGSRIRLGNKGVQFIETRMLHWPDSMFSYIKEDGLLISSDAFGQHWATSERFDDEVDLSELLSHAGKYYANILLPFSPLIQKLLSNIQEIGIEIDMIAPDHGLIWRTNPAKIIDAYDIWSQQRCKQKAIVIYDTMWHSTEMMAKSIINGLLLEGIIDVKMLDLRVNHRSDIITEVLDAKGVIFGSPTLNNGMLPRMADMLSYMKGLRPSNKIGASFGSYGWSGEAVKLINHAMEEMKIKVIDPGIKVNYVPTHDDLRQCVELGRRIGRAIKEDT